MEDKPLPDVSKFIQKLLPIAKIEDAIARLESYANAQFDAVHGATLLTLEAEVQDLNTQIQRSACILQALDKQKNSIPRVLKQSPLTQGDDKNEASKKPR
jgi:hypothetical protein